MLFPRRRDKTAIAGLVIYAGCLAIAVMWFVEYRLGHTADEARGGPGGVAADNRYVGTILIPGGPNGLCRRIEFDNITGALREGAAATCTDDSPLDNSTEGRVGAIRDAFAKR
jgi:hypothetical protein